MGNLQQKVDACEDLEKCVCGCNRLTNVRRDTPIDQRTYYIEGVGQLLPECYKKIYE